MLDNRKLVEQAKEKAYLIKLQPAHGLWTQHNSSNASRMINCCRPTAYKKI